MSPGDSGPGCFTIAGIDSLLMSAALGKAVTAARAAAEAALAEAARTGAGAVTWLGLLLGAQRRADDEAAIYRAVRDEARAAVRAGFRVVVAPEHAHAEPYRMLQPWPLLGAVREAVGAPVAAVASVIAGLTTAERLAADVATLRGIGAGPAGVALAAGYRREDFASAGRDFDARFDVRGPHPHRPGRARRLRRRLAVERCGHRPCRAPGRGGRRGLVRRADADGGPGGAPSRPRPGPTACCAATSCSAPAPPTSPTAGSASSRPSTAPTPPGATTTA